MQNDKTKKYNHLIYRRLCIIPPMHRDYVASVSVVRYLPGYCYLDSVFGVMSFGKRLRRDGATSIFAIT